MNPKEIILKAFARADKERGLRIIAPDSYLSLFISQKIKIPPAKIKHYKN